MTMALDASGDRAARNREGVRRWNLAHPGLDAQRKKDARAKNPEHFAAVQREYRSVRRELVNEQHRELMHRDPRRELLRNSKQSARKRGLPYDLTIDDVPIPEFCPALGLRLIKGKGVRTDSSPSIDRIIPSKGYVKGNVLVVSWKANRIKNDATVSELMAVAKFYTAFTKVG